MKKVGVIGGSGFIGSYITKIFLENNFEVKVSATDISQKKKYQHLMEFKRAGNLHISELNVESKDELRDFVKDCDILIYGGTPFQLKTTNLKRDLFDPTINGTENFLQVILHSPNISKVIFIACVTVFNGNFAFSSCAGTKEDVSPFLNKEFHAYARAKYLANQMVVDFVNNNPSLPFEITTISPVAVMGKSLSAREDATSTILQTLFKNKITNNDFIKLLFEQDILLAMIAVKDVARAVFNAATKTGNHGKNYLLSSESYSISDISMMLNNLQPKNNPKIIYQNQDAQDELGFDFQPAIFPLQEYSRQKE